MAVKKFIIKTFLNGVQVDKQEVNNSAQLKDNAYVNFYHSKKLKADGGDIFTGGTNGNVTGLDHENARNAFQSYHFNVLAVPTTDEEIQWAYVEYTKRLREEYGVLFQMVTPNLFPRSPYNHEGIIAYANKVEAETDEEQTTGLTYWLAGAEAACKVESSVMNQNYDGNYRILADVTREEQLDALDRGVILFHNVGKNTVVLRDINTLTTIEDKDVEKKSLEFKNNQTVRVIDSISTDTANIFNNSYLGKSPNNDINRELLRTQILENRDSYVKRQAIAEYDPSKLVLSEGENRRQVVGVETVMPINCMEQLFLKITVL